MLELVRVREGNDRRHLVLPGVGETRVAGFFKPVMTLTSPKGTWTFGGKLGLRSQLEAVEPSGLTAAVARLDQRLVEYGPRTFRLVGGKVEKGTKGRSDVQLFEGDRLVAQYEPVQWAKETQRVTVDERFAAEDGLMVLLCSFAAGYWVGRDSISAAASAAR